MRRTPETELDAHLMDESQSVSRLRAMMLALWFALMVPGVAVANHTDWSPSDPQSRRLMKPLVSVIEGRPLRSTLQRIADETEVNIWLDRKVDPTSPADVGQAGPTVFAALEAIAESRDCVLFPLHNMVLIGRPEWVDRTASSLMRLPPLESQKRRLARIAWPTLTTPTEALAVAAGQAPPADTVLPHDLWPAVAWNDLERRVAVSLVLAQFDLRVRDAAALSLPADSRQRNLLRDRAWVPSNLGGRFDRRYEVDGALAAVAEVARQLDSRAEIVRDRGGLLVSGTAAAHRVVVCYFLRAATPPSPGRPGQMKRFTLRLKNKPACAVLKQLARAAGKEIEIEADASVCGTLVTLEAENNTLEELATTVAEQAGLTVSWGERVVVSPSSDLQERAPPPEP